MEVPWRDEPKEQCKSDIMFSIIVREKSETSGYQVAPSIDRVLDRNISNRGKANLSEWIGWLSIRFS